MLVRESLHVELVSILNGNCDERQVAFLTRDAGTSMFEGGVGNELVLKASQNTVGGTFRRSGFVKPVKMSQ